MQAIHTVCKTLLTMLIAPELQLQELPTSGPVGWLVGQSHITNNIVFCVCVAAIKRLISTAHMFYVLCYVLLLYLGLARDVRE